MSCGVPALKKYSLIAMEYILIHATESTDEVIFHNWFLGIFKDMLVQISLFFLIKYLLVHKYWVFKSVDASQIIIARIS